MKVLCIFSVAITFCYLSQLAVAEDPCPNGELQVQCQVEPCSVALCSEYDDANCTNNYCGSCKADFYLGDTKLDENQCNGCITELGQQYSSCPLDCDPTCKEPAKDCSLKRTTPCKARCACPDEMYVDTDGSCVPKQNCSTSSAVCPSNQQWLENVPCVWQCGQSLASTICPIQSFAGCACPNGTLWDGDRCTLNCPTCPGNQKFSTCATCTVTCAEKDNPPACTLECRSECSCPFGTFLLGDFCVSSEDCSSPPPPTIGSTTSCPGNQSYVQRPQCTVPCKYKDTPPPCAPDIMYGCGCGPGFYLLGVNCVTYDACPMDTTTTTSSTNPTTPTTVSRCPVGLVYSECVRCIWQCSQDPKLTLCPNICRAGCTCPNNTLWDGNTCASDCSGACPGNQTYVSHSHCKRTCHDKDRPIPCANVRNYGCGCSSGFLLGDDCVPYESCPMITTPPPTTTTTTPPTTTTTTTTPPTTTTTTTTPPTTTTTTTTTTTIPTCPSNQVYSLSPPCIWQCGQDPETTLCPAIPSARCTCPNGTLWDGDTCGPGCPECPGNQVFSLCSSCLISCDKRNDTSCITLCRIGCGCPSGNFLDGDNCVTAENCPAPCPDGVKRQSCSPPPCKGVTCPHFHFAKCVNNNCGGCKAEFYDRSVFISTSNCMGCNPSLGEVWDTCANPCDATCDDLEKPCSLQEVCTPRCRCPSGYVRNVQNKCVLVASCNPCPSNQIYYKYSRPCPWECGKDFSSCFFTRFTSGCSCPKDLRWDGENCVKESKCPVTCEYDSLRYAMCPIDPCLTSSCPAHKDAVCKNDYCLCEANFYKDGVKLSHKDCIPTCNSKLNEVWDPCAASCDFSCQSPYTACITPYPCRGRCSCPLNHYRNDQNVCVRRQKCPARCPGGQIFHDCKPCGQTCEDPKLVCALICTPGCACATGKYWNGTDCVGPSGCPKKSCPSNQVYSVCAADRHCSRPFFNRFGFDGMLCVPGCSCPTYLYWNGTRCVSIGQCLDW